jgi:hypothetical protein
MHTNQRDYSKTFWSNKRKTTKQEKKNVSNRFELEEKETMFYENRWCQWDKTLLMILTSVHSYFTQVYFKLLSTSVSSFSSDVIHHCHEW